MMTATDRQGGPLDFEEDPRYAQANREAWWAVGYWALFTVVVTGLAWWLGYEKAADELTFVMGFPTWFFWSVLMTSLVFSAIPVWIIRRNFKDVPLTRDGKEPPVPTTRTEGR
jgi:uncharacterized membrane protein YhdT